jgi:hypothetical protein
MAAFFMKGGYLKNMILGSGMLPAVVPSPPSLFSTEMERRGPWIPVKQIFLLHRSGEKPKMRAKTGTWRHGCG